MAEMKVYTNAKEKVRERFKKDPESRREWLQMAEKYRNDSTPLGMIGAEMEQPKPRTPDELEEVLDAFW